MSRRENQESVPGSRPRLRHRLMLAGASVIGTLGLLEGALWLVHPLPPRPAERVHRFLPSWEIAKHAPRTLEFDPGPLSGVTPGVRHARLNEYGFLYPIEKHRRASADELRIAAIGGSTVECIALPEDKRWPSVLARTLGAALPDRPVTVLNLGLSAQDSRTHLATAAQLIARLDLDIAVFMLGANDLSRANGGDRLLGQECFHPPPRISESIKRALRATQISRHLSSWKKSIRSPSTVPYFHEQAIHQAALPMATVPPIPESALAEYALDVRTLAGICTAHGITPVFATTPTMLPDEPSPEQLAVYWGCVSGDSQVSPASLNASLGMLNSRLMRTCREDGHVCVDLEAAVPKGLDCFYDQVHFNERGAQIVGETVAESIRWSVAGRTRR